MRQPLAGAELESCRHIVAYRPHALSNVGPTKTESRIWSLAMRRIWICVLMAGLLQMLYGCEDGKTSASITGYNHMKHLYIGSFSVNDGMGPDASPENGGKEACCVSIPRVWQSGYKLKVRWNYDKLSGDPVVVPPHQEVELDLPKYVSPGRMQVHFYENNKIKIVISNCSIAHPFYPLSPDDLRPFKPSGTKREMREAATRAGGSVDCRYSFCS